MEIREKNHLLCADISSASFFFFVTNCNIWNVELRGDLKGHLVWREENMNFGLPNPGFIFVKLAGPSVMFFLNWCIYAHLIAKFDADFNFQAQGGTLASTNLLYVYEDCQVVWKLYHDFLCSILINLHKSINQNWVQF